MVSASGPVVYEGWEPTEADAKRTAVGAMRHVIELGEIISICSAAPSPA